MDAPSQALIVGRLGTISNLLLESLPQIVGRSFIAIDDGDPYEDCLLNAHVRRKIKNLFKAMELESEEDDDSETVVTVAHSNIGLEAIYNGVRFHIHMGAALPPARTKRRRRFYSHQTDPMQMRLALDEQPDSLTIVGHSSYLWTFDPESRTLTLDLVCPMWANLQVAEAWRHPLLVTTLSMPGAQSSEDDDDLAIYLNDSDDRSYLDGIEEEGDIDEIQSPGEDESERGSGDEKA